MFEKCWFCIEAEVYYYLFIIMSSIVTYTIPFMIVYVFNQRFCLAFPSLLFIEIFALFQNATYFEKIKSFLGLFITTNSLFCFLRSLIFSVIFFACSLGKFNNVTSLSCEQKMMNLSRFSSQIIQRLKFINY